VVTVAELIEELQEFDPNAEIVVFHATTGYFYDCDGTREHEDEDEEGKPGGCVLCVSG
jgi:hypothetical protein